MAADQDLARLVRSYVAGLDRNAGATVPVTKDSQANPIYDAGAATVSPNVGTGQTGSWIERGSTEPARRGRPNDFNWRPQDRMEVKAYRETMAVPTVGADGKVEIDPDVCTSWYVAGPGTITVTLVDPEEIESEDGYAPKPTTTSLVSVWVARQAGASIVWPGDLKFSKTLRDSLVGSGNPFGAATAFREDVYTLQWIPGRGWYLFIAGQDMG